MKTGEIWCYNTQARVTVGGLERMVKICATLDELFLLVEIEGIEEDIVIFSELGPYAFVNGKLKCVSEDEIMRGCKMSRENFLNQHFFVCESMNMENVKKEALLC